MDSVQQRCNFKEYSGDVVVVQRGGREVVHIGASVHKGRCSRVRVVVHVGYSADCSRKEEGATGKPEGQSSEPVSDNIIG